MKTINTLINDVEKVLGGESELSGSNLDAAIEKAGDEFKTLLRNRILNSYGDSTALRLSAIGRSCNRLHWFNAKGYPTPDLLPATKMKFLFGDISELLMIFLARVAGHTVEREQEEVEVEGIKGHIDCVIDGVLVDIKTASPYSFAKFKDGTLQDNDSFGYIGQLKAYSEATGIKDRYNWVLNKVNGAQCLYKHPDDVPSATDRVVELKKVTANALAPDRGYKDIPDGKSGNRKLCVECSYCSYKEHCWEGLRTFIYSTGPRFLTKVENVPKVLEVFDEYKEV